MLVQACDLAPSAVEPVDLSVDGDEQDRVGNPVGFVVERQQAERRRREADLAQRDELGDGIVFLVAAVG